MNLTDLARLRLSSQQISSTQFSTSRQLAGWMCAMQAQDYAMLQWALGARLPGSTVADVEAAVASAEIIRTHLLRPTWHLVAAEDLRWLLGLTAPRLRASLKPRHAGLGLSDAVHAESQQIMLGLLSGGRQLTGEELGAEFEKANIPTGENRLSHLLMRAELDALLCSGATRKGKRTYALLDERVPPAPALSRDEALGRLAFKYFSSHGPATLADFAWWSGQTTGEARRALELVSADFVSVTVASQEYWYSAAALAPVEESACLLPAFDEFIISYTDRAAALALENFSKAVSNNGVFRPVIVVDGQVTGIWRRTTHKDHLLLETQFFSALPDRLTLERLEQCALQFGQFFGKRIEIQHQIYE